MNITPNPPNAVDVFMLQKPEQGNSYNWYSEGVRVDYDLYNEGLMVDLVTGQFYLRDNFKTYPIDSEVFQGKPYFDVDQDEVLDPIYIIHTPERAYLFAKPSAKAGPDSYAPLRINGDLVEDERLTSAEAVTSDPRFAQNPGLKDILELNLGDGELVLITGQDTPMLKNTLPKVLDYRVQATGKTPTQ